MTLKCCGGWCSLFVCDIETYNRMYQNKIQLVLCVREISLLWHISDCAVQNKIIWMVNKFCGRQFYVKFLFFLYVSALNSVCLLEVIVYNILSYLFVEQAFFLLKSNFKIRFYCSFTSYLSMFVGWELSYSVIMSVGKICGVTGGMWMNAL